MSISRSVLPDRLLLVAIILDSSSRNIGRELARARPAAADPLEIDSDQAHVTGVGNRMRNVFDFYRSVIRRPGRIGTEWIKWNRKVPRNKAFRDDLVPIVKAKGFSLLSENFSRAQIFSRETNRVVRRTN